MILDPYRNLVVMPPLKALTLEPFGAIGHLSRLTSAVCGASHENYVS